ncbi:peptidase M18 [Globomyces pollinis-pini]|nr:peptidase M18 [Globomyces pollinis-pini]
MNLPKEFLRFVDASPSPFHAVESSIQRLVKAGFQEIQEENSWDNLKPNGKYFFTRNRSAIVSFVIGGKWKQGNGFSIVGAHTDSPCLKVKPRSKRDKLGYKQVGVEIYGGGLWHTWFDRDLSLAGRVLIESNGIFEHKLVKINRPILRIPTLAIHLDRNSGDNFTFNKEVQLTPILTEAAAKELNKTKTETESDRHHPEMLELIAKEMGCEVAQIRDFELCLYDTQPASIGGANDEFIHSARLDNLMMSFCGLTAICETTDESVKNDDLIRMVTLFDNEEVGSTTAHGADSNLLEVTLRRLSSLAVGAVEEGSFERAMVKSMLISADMAHALHPNYPEKHEDNHRPAMNKGVVIKQNANQRYATTSITTHILREAAAIASVKLQEFVVRNDSPCGSTIGPMLSAKLGLRTVDVGNPQWSMHSIRETCGTKDVGDAVLLFKAFFDGLSKIDSKMPRL